MVSVLLFSATWAQNNNQPKDFTKVFEVKNAEYDFGKIPFGKAVEYEVSVKNISHDTATLDNVQVGCGCTTPKYEKGKKFAPGETVKIVLGFNGGTMGAFTKYVTIFLNGNTLSKQLLFKGETYTAPANPAPANSAIQKLKPSNS